MIVGSALVQPVPGVARGELGLVPLELGRVGAGRGPLALEVGFDLVERAAGVTAARLPAMLIGWPKIVIRPRLFIVGTRRVVLTPVSVFGGRVDRLGNLLASQATRDAANHRAGDG